MLCVCMHVCVCVCVSVHAYIKTMSLAPPVPLQAVLEPPGPPRLLVAFTEGQEQDALLLLPAMLRGYVERLLLNSSLIQVRP